MDEYLGIIKIFAGNFAPRGWAFCDGSLIPISQNTALFSLLGTYYGGNGSTTFALPDLRGRVAVGAGNGPNLTPMVIGQTAGANNVTLNSTQMPNHTHLLAVNTGNATANSPAGGVLAAGNFEDPASGASMTTNNYAAAPNGTANQQAISPAGGNQPFSVMQPSLGLNYIICISGMYPSRN